MASAVLDSPAVLNRTRQSATEPSIRSIPKGHAQKRSWKVLAGLTSAAVVVTAVSAWAEPWTTDSPTPVAAESQTAEPLKAVTIEFPAPATTASVVLPATIRPWQTTTLFARVSGYLIAWHRDLGARVNAGDVLAEIATPELDQELAEGQALAREAEAAVVQARAERVEAQADLKVAEAQLDRVRAEIALSRSQLVRREKLLASRVVTQEEYETYLRQVEARAADLAAAESDIVRRRTNVETRAAIIQVREATANSRRANVERLNELQIFKRIVAPFAGVVTHRTAEVGMLVSAGKESLFVLEDMSRVRVQLNVPQTYAAQTTLGVAASISLPESAQATVSGTITRVADSVDSTNRTMLAEIELENAESRFQPGSYAQVTLTTPQNGTAWTIPTNTLSMRVEGPHVVLVNDRNQIEIKRVSLGRDLGRRIVVVEGIRGHERLVVNPTDDLLAGLGIQINNSREVDHDVVRNGRNRSSAAPTVSGLVDPAYTQP